MTSTVSTFPQVYADLDVHSLRTAYSLAPSRLRAALAGLSSEQVRRRPRGDGTWSALEIARHLSDAELIGASRFRMALAMPGAPLPAYDQVRFAEHLDYLSLRSAVLEEVVQLFDYLRATTLRLLDVSTNRWTTSWGLHAEWGELTVRNLLELYADHGERHIAQIVEIRRLLGEPIALPPLLPNRLY